MRTCMYCGNELAKGEKCTCADSRARRGEDDTVGKDTEKNTDKGASYSDPYRTKTSYKTGYAGGDSRFERAKNRYRAKRAAKATRGAFKGMSRKRLWEYISASVKMPVETVTNPAHLGKVAMLVIAAAMGAVLWLCLFSIRHGGAAGPLKVISAAMGMDGGYRLLKGIIAALVYGAAGGLVIFFVYTGIFYFINRFIMRMQTPYWSFCERLVAAWIPFTLICFIGSLLSLLSPLTLAAMVLCGAVTAAILTYEALKAEWYSASPSKIVYAMILGYFVFLSIMLHLLLI